jgi:DNA topoisomerase-1
MRDATKFSRMIAFGGALPRIRKQVEADLRPRTLSKRKVSATILRLLETTGIRVGNREYAKQNHSFGLTTLHNRHVHVEGSRLRFEFRGKSGQEQDVEMRDHQLAGIVRRLHDLPGCDLFEYIDDAGLLAKITSEDINEYLREISGENFTAKDFRTWMGTRLTVLALESIGEVKTKARAKRNVVRAIRSVAQRLGNRPTTCRKYYIHPAILEAYATGSLLGALKLVETNPSHASLFREENCVMSLIKLYEQTSPHSARLGDR